jgi:hypothetical protein
MCPHWEADDLVEPWGLSPGGWPAESRQPTGSDRWARSHASASSPTSRCTYGFSRSTRLWRPRCRESSSRVPPIHTATKSMIGVDHGTLSDYTGLTFLAVDNPSKDVASGAVSPEHIHDAGEGRRGARGGHSVETAHAQASFELAKSSGQSAEVVRVLADQAVGVFRGSGWRRRLGQRFRRRSGIRRRGGRGPRQLGRGQARGSRAGSQSQSTSRQFACGRVESSS